AAAAVVLRKLRRVKGMWWLSLIPTILGQADVHTGSPVRPELALRALLAHTTRGSRQTPRRTATTGSSESADPSRSTSGPAHRASGSCTRPADRETSRPSPKPAAPRALRSTPPHCHIHRAV